MPQLVVKAQHLLFSWKFIPAKVYYLKLYVSLFVPFRETGKRHETGSERVGADLLYRYYVRGKVDLVIVPSRETRENGGTREVQLSQLTASSSTIFS